MKQKIPKYKEIIKDIEELKLKLAQFKVATKENTQKLIDSLNKKLKILHQNDDLYLLQFR